MIDVHRLSCDLAEDEIFCPEMGRVAGWDGVGVGVAS